MSDRLNIHTIVSQPFEENTYILWLSSRRDCLVVDPGLEPDRIVEFLQDQDRSVAAILNTHGHADHIGGNETLKASFPSAPLIIGAGDAHMLTDADANLSALYGLPIFSPPADRTVREGDLVEHAGFSLEVLELPGHSPGHVIYLWRGRTPIHVLGGDVLFRGSIGRSDFPGGNGELLLDGIHRKLFTLPADTIVYPGHGPVTTVGHEKKYNPFVGETALA